MPDQFGGDAAPNTSASDADAQVAAAAQNLSILERIKMGAAETAKSFLIDMWLARHTAEKVLPILGKVLEAAREEFADAVANGAGVSFSSFAELLEAFGLCWARSGRVLAGTGSSRGSRLHEVERLY